MSVTPTPVHVVHSSTANTASVIAALARCGAEPVLTEDPGAIERAERLVLPGVGSFGAMMRQLADTGVVEILRERLRDERPTLGICLGMQVFFESSEESPGVRGLAVAPGRVARFRDPGGAPGAGSGSGPSGAAPLRIPQFGWNSVAADAACRVLASGPVYFANSYRATDAEALRAAGWRLATARHGGAFIAAVERGQHGQITACQFHPELSGPLGAALLRRWLGAAERRSRAAAEQQIGAPE